MYRPPLLSLPARSLLLGAITLAWAAGAGDARAQPLDDVCELLRQRAEEVAPQIGLVIVDLRSEARCAINAGESFRSGSLYKLIVLAEAYEQEARGDFSLDEPITLEPRQYVDDPPELRRSEPLEMSAQEALRRMVVLSDNAAALALRERLDPVAVDAAPARLGLDGTALGELFVTTPADIAQFFSAVYRGELVSAQASEQMLALLSAQGLNDLIPAVLPAGTEVAHKTGLIEEYLHDAGIVFAPGGDYVFVLLTRWQEAIEESYLAIHELTALAYGAFATPFEPPPPVVEAAAGAPETVDQALSVAVEEPPSPLAALPEGEGDGSVGSEGSAPGV